MPGLSYKVRTTLTVWRQGLWRYRLTAAGGLLAVWGAATSLSELPTVVNAAVGAVGLVTAVLEIRSNRRSSALLEFHPRKTDEYRDVVEQLSAPDRIVRTATDVGAVLSRQTDQLLTGTVNAQIASGDFDLHQELRRYSFDFLARRARKGAMHNDPVLGLASDLPVDPASEPVTFRRAMYFDFVCSNLLAQNDAYSATHQMPVLSGRRLFIDRQGKLRPFAHSRLANTVGVSTLAFTSDGKLVLVKQTNDNVGSPGLFAPSGSGALEPKDLNTNNNNPLTVRSVVLNGAERELQEECNIKPEEIISSCVVGHARWISRGAMPEFSAVTLLNLTSDELMTRGIRRSERTFVHRVQTVRLNDPKTWDADRPLDMLSTDDRTQSSWPLALALSCLAERITDQHWPMREGLLDALNGQRRP